MKQGENHTRKNIYISKHRVICLSQNTDKMIESLLTTNMPEKMFWILTENANLESNIINHIQIVSSTR